MDFKDVSARLKKTKEGSEGAETQPKPIDFAESYRIRAKMVGVLLHDARVNAARTLEDCARLLRVSPEQIEAWEFGDDVPSLPQLEILAYYLDVPVSHFWGMNTLETERASRLTAQGEYIALRMRMIGALLRFAREQNEMSIEALSQASGIPADQIAHYELGELPLPMHELTVLAGHVRKNISYFLETNSSVGEWLALQENWKRFAELPDDIRQFVSNPLNGGFIEIAILLSQMPVDRLRRVGESVLSITM
jgi:transcriptional regulator with XRE-family HTH domain